MNNTPTNKYSEIVEQVKQAECIILLNLDLVLAQEILSQQGKELIETIKINKGDKVSFEAKESSRGIRAVKVRKISERSKK